MKCPICKNGKIIKGKTLLVFENEKSTIIIKKVPATVCNNCDESFVDEETSKKLFDMVEKESKKHIEVEILNYAA